MSEKGSSSGIRLVLSDKRIYAILIAVLLLSIVAIGYVVTTSSGIQSEPLPVVNIGDHVYVDYVGFFAPNPGGWVFDTSKRIVAYDDAITKSLYFHQREPKEYTSLNFTAGISGNLLDPFIDGVVGMIVTQTKTISIPAENAYPVNPENIVSLPLNQSVPVLETISINEFVSTYELTPSLGLQVQHSYWEWNMVVVNISGDIVTYQNEPWIDQIVSAYGDPSEDPRDGWYQRVIAVDPSANGGLGQITVANLITSQDAYQKKGLDNDMRYFTLVEVNEESKTFTLHYNDQNYIGELAGRTLYFEITVNKVLKG